MVWPSWMKYWLILSVSKRVTTLPAICQSISETHNATAILVRVGTYVNFLVVSTSLPAP